MRPQRPQILLFCLFFSMLLFFAFFYLFSPAPKLLERENRMSADFPDLSFDSYRSGRLSAGLSRFAADSVPFRDAFTSFAALSELALGKRERGGILYTDGGRLIATPRGEGDFTESNARAIAQLSAYGVPFYRFTVPTAYEVYTKGDARFSLSDYYLTDHHLNEKGARRLAEAIAERLSLPLPRVTYTRFGGDFYGTGASALGVDLLPDAVYLPRYAGDGALSADADGKAIPVYDASAEGRRDLYTVFFGGNYPLLSVTKKEAGKRPPPLVVKGSYMNAVAPLLADAADLLLCDPRYFDGDFDALVSAYAPDAILLVSGSELLGESDALTRLFDTW